MSRSRFLGILTLVIILLLFSYVHDIGKRIDRLEFINKLHDRYDNYYGIPIDKLPFIGKANAKHTIVLVTDYTCPYCNSVYHQIESLRTEYIDSGKLKIVFLNYPLESHVNSSLLGRIAKFCYRSGKFDEGYHQLYAKHDSITYQTAVKYFQNVIPDTIQLKLFLEGTSCKDLEIDSLWTSRLNIKGVPAFIEGGRVSIGKKEDEDMREFFEAICKEQEPSEQILPLYIGSPFLFSTFLKNTTP